MSEDTIVLWTLGAAFVLAAAFPIIYSTPPSRPFSSGPGRAAWIFSVMVALVLGLAFARRAAWITLPPGTPVVVYFLILVGVLIQLVALLRARHKARIKRRSVSDERTEVSS